MTNKPEEQIILPALEDIADAIIKLSKMGEEIKKTRLKQKTVTVLLAKMGNMPQRDVEIVLNNLAAMRQEYLK